MYVPRFRFPATSGTILLLTLPMRYWSRRQSTLGGRREAAAGGVNVASRTIRRDYLLDVVLRFDETEHDDLETMLAWQQDNPATPFDFWPDYDGTPGTSYTALLISPVQGEEFAPSRGEFASVLEATLTLRRSSGAAWPLVWYPD